MTDGGLPLDAEEGRLLYDIVACGQCYLSLMAEKNTTFHPSSPLDQKKTPLHVEPKRHILMHPQFVLLIWLAFGN